MFGKAKKTYWFYYEKKQVQKPNDEDLSVVVIIAWNAQQVETLSSKQQQLKKKKPSEKFSAKLNQRPTIAEWRCEKIYKRRHKLEDKYNMNNRPIPPSKDQTKTELLDKIKGSNMWVNRTPTKGSKQDREST